MYLQSPRIAANSFSLVWPSQHCCFTLCRQLIARKIVYCSEFFICTISITAILVSRWTYINVRLPEVLIIFQHCDHFVNRVGLSFQSWHSEIIITHGIFRQSYIGGSRSGDANSITLHRLIAYYEYAIIITSGGKITEAGTQTLQRRIGCLPWICKNYKYM